MFKSIYEESEQLNVGGLQVADQQFIFAVLVDHVEQEQQQELQVEPHCDEVDLDDLDPEAGRLHPSQAALVDE